MPDAEETSLGEFVQELTDCQSELLYFIRALCDDPDSAADIRQAVNIILWRKRKAFRPGTSFKNWAFRVAQIEVKAYMRKQAKARTTPLNTELLDLFARELPKVADELPERQLALAECVRGLTPKDEQLIRHHYWSSATLDTLAAATNRSVGTLKARLFQLRISLRRCIRKKLQTV
ncbi:sigma-70 family RNA polymerase sigma factor [Luteolibacter marinus]|uniref:sigma-70 family RNA polymerase sigma factor n=1 Tax=Luteolibacter marinus TaxID=2776705 RepID=UPI001866B33A|nr:sigma-70 family RNA polymerase sigma factor [Luteolibacter marinus]